MKLNSTKMKRLLLLFLFTFALYTVYGQVETKYYPKGNAFEQEKHIKEHPKANKIKEFSSFDVEKLKEEDEQN